MKPELTNVKKFYDNRGYFTIPFKNMKQINLSQSKQGVIRGMHFQNKPHEQAKSVYVLEGIIEDVIVDMNNGDTYSFVMKEGDLLYVPRGYAHGFEALTNTKIMYGVDNIYSPSDEGIIRWDTIDHQWKTNSPIMSDKDVVASSLDEVLRGWKR